LDAKVSSRLFLSFEKSIPEWLTFIHSSFLNETLKETYKRLILDRWNVLQKGISKTSLHYTEDFLKKT
jgi:hypothetical protein